MHLDDLIFDNVSDTPPENWFNYTSNKMYEMMQNAHSFTEKTVQHVCGTET